jgi:hypothetical protein
MAKTGIRYFVVVRGKLLRIKKPCMVNFDYPQRPCSFWVWDRRVLSALRLGCWVVWVVREG